MSFIVRKTSQKDSNKIPSSRGLGHRQCLIIDHATHSGLFYAPWNLIARFIHGTCTGWFSHKKQRVESAEQSQSPLFPEVALSGQEMSTLFEESGGGGTGAWLLPLQPLAPFHKQGLGRWATPLSCAFPPDTGFMTAVVLKWILCICHQRRNNTDLRAIFKTCQYLQL